MVQMSILEKLGYIFDVLLYYDEFTGWILFSRFRTLFILGDCESYFVLFYLFYIEMDEEDSRVVDCSIFLC